MAKILKTQVARFGIYLVMAVGGVMLLAMVGPVSSASAATIPVTTISDEYGTGADTCSLREAITAANTDAAFGGCVAGSGSDVVNVPAGVYVLTRVGSNEDNNATGDLDLRTAMVVSGAGQSVTIVDANRLDRAFHVPVAGMNFELAGLTVQHGLASDAMGGGAYVSDGAAVITGSTFMSNTATQYGGGLFVNRAVTVTNSSFISNTSVISTGGGLYANAQATISNTQFLSNTSVNTFIADHPNFRIDFVGGAGMYARGAVAISDSDFYYNNGGALFADQQVSVTHSQFVSNTGLSGHFSFGSPLFLRKGGGGGIYSFYGPVIISESLFQLNVGGGVYVFVGEAVVTHTSFISNGNEEGGGGITSSSAIIYGSEFRSNTGGLAGGIYATGTITVESSSFVENLTPGGAGAILTYRPVWISDTLFQRNQSTGGTSGAIHFSDGGLIQNSVFISNVGKYSAGAIYLDIGLEEARIINTLLVDNITSSGEGAAIWNLYHPLTLLHVTIANSRVVSGSAIYIQNEETFLRPVVVRNTIIASHTVGINVITYGSGSPPPPVNALAVVEDHNLYYGNEVNRNGVLPGVGSLNGDPAFVNPLGGDFHLRLDSAAIDRGSDMGITPDFDGNPRPPGVNPDIGYVEFSGVVVAGLTANNDSPQLQDAPVQFTASITAGTDVSYQWSFDDGQSGTGITTTHTYEVPGIYTATVIATDRFGGTAIVTIPVTITVPQNPNLTGALNAEFVGRLVTYTFVVSNPNPVQPATNVVVSGSVPPDTALVSTNGISVVSGGYYGLGYVTLPTATLTPTTLAPTQQITLTWTVNVPVLKGSITTRGGATSDNAMIDRRVLVRVVFRTYLPVLSRE